MCPSRRVLSRHKAESELLAGIKAKGKPPEYVQECDHRSASQVREHEQGADKKLLAAELSKVEHEIGTL